MDVKEKIQKILDDNINVKLVLHGGGASLTSVEDGIASIKFTGACAGCMSQTDTFDNVIKATLLEKVPEIRDVVIDEGVDDDLLNFAKAILNGKR